MMMMMMFYCVHKLPDDDDYDDDNDDNDDEAVSGWSRRRLCANSGKDQHRPLNPQRLNEQRIPPKLEYKWDEVQHEVRGKA